MCKINLLCALIVWCTITVGVEVGTSSMIQDIPQQQQQQTENQLCDQSCQIVTPQQNITQNPHDKVYRTCGEVPSSGVYTIQPEKPFKQPMSVLCDQKYDSGRWTVIQHRFNGSTNFYRNWKEYKNGFGNLDGEFWLGLDRIYQLTVSRPYELVVVLEDFGGNKTYAKYDLFEIGDESQKYEATKVGGYTGTAGNSFSGTTGMKFSTFDADNDIWEKHCAVTFTGAWWYNNCHMSNLNGKYLRGETKEYATGMVWATFRGHHYALKTSKMMIRPKKV
ncbi:microfibril-associated glycoprotein 4-like [Anopheles marshallii]|uniref:microfibril-associated glycoprotein 4-like n=1 Tax=Anopheles marshallii TaxID=1521116 RepID=UPI00237B7AF8|nr:microfibril-associated glycoprotein 4-like [Anopheles marshallii]